MSLHRGHARRRGCIVWRIGFTGSRFRESIPNDAKSQEKGTRSLEYMGAYSDEHFNAMPS